MGGAAFELTNTFREVVGVDSSEAFINAAEEMKKEGQRAFSRKEEGEIESHLMASIDVTIDRTRCSFLVDDPCSMAARNYGEFDAVLVSDCLDRIHAPAECLERLVGEPGASYAILLRLPYATSGTDSAYGATRAGQGRRHRGSGLKDTVQSPLLCSYALAAVCPTHSRMPYTLAAVSPTRSLRDGQY